MALMTKLKELEKDRSNLIKALQTAQEIEGYVSDEAIKMVSEYLSLPIVDIEGVVSFYTQFKRVKPGKYLISVCDGTACHIKNSSLVLNWVSDELKIKNGETDPEGVFSLETVACLGCCSLAPVISVNGKVYGNLDRKGLMRILRQYKREELKAKKGGK